MVYVMPNYEWDTYKSAPYKLLRDTADAIQERYKATTVYVDTPVVVVEYTDFKIEVQPVFEDEEGFWYPCTKGKGCYKLTKPREEIAATREIDLEKNGNLRRLARMTRAWKNKHGVPMNGLVVDTLAHNFLTDQATYDNTSYAACGQMMRDFLSYLSELPNQDRYHALGSGQHVKVRKPFQRKAKKGLGLADKALEAGEDSSANKRWRKLFGRHYPHAAGTEVKKAEITEANFTAANTEEFIEDLFPTDVRYALRLECEITQQGFRAFLLRAGRRMGVARPTVYRSKSLRFYVADHNIKGTFHIYWKVLNRGPEAIRRDMIRGQIEKDGGSRTKKEHSNFRGEHVVDCYAVQNDVVVAKDRIHVPIIDESES